MPSVIVIDTEPLLTSTLRDVLQGSSHALESFQTASEALAHLDAGATFDVAFVARTLSDRSGLELANALKQRDRNAELVIITSEHTAEIASEVLQIGACGYLPRSHCDGYHLRLKLEQALEKVLLRRSHETLTARLVHDALHDTLTGLPNRALLLDRIGRALKHAHRHPSYQFAVLMLDVDRFKTINDGLGHEAGDEMLREVTKRLLRCIRANDTVARLGGDEFGIFLDGLDDERDTTRVAERILAELNEPYSVGGHQAYSTASIGITHGATRYQRPEFLLRDADIAMHRAKVTGKSRYQMFDEAMHERALRQLHMETDLRRAIERGEFTLHYQPIISLESGAIIGFEALVRWMSPERGMVSPAEFIPLAEETGLIVPLGRWVLKTACEQLRQWCDRFPDRANLTMSVNLSSRQFNQPDLIEGIRAIIDDTGILPDLLKLEITESVIMDNPDFAKSILMELKSLHVAVVIDDFGTGYSSLSYLNYFPIDELKIDRTFVHKMDGNGYDAEIVQTIITLSRRLEIDVVAEGVETEKQLAKLRSMNCNFAQGFLFAKPLREDAALDLITGQPQW